MLKGHDITNKKVLAVIFAAIVLGVVLLIMDYFDTQKNFNGTLIRNETGNGSYSQRLLFEAGEYASDIEITVNDIRITKEQAGRLFIEAKQEIEKTCLGENISPDHIVTDLKFSESYANGLVEARWQLDNYEVINTDGTIVEEKTSSEGNLVNAIVYLNCGEYQELYNLSFMVYEPDSGSYAAFIKRLKENIAAEDEKTAESAEITLPKDCEEVPVYWKKPMNYRGLQLMILGVVAGFAIAVGKQREEKNQAQKILEAKSKDYPEIVSNLSILMAAGISFKGSIERISKRYMARKKKDAEFRKEGYEEILRTYREMKDGVGELEAIENLGARSGCKEFRKLSMLLSQNLRKGSRELVEMLEKEEALSFELRKQNALKAGEEASTKLLLPMLGMLGIVVVILIVPATMQMNM